MREPVEINPMTNQWLLDHAHEAGDEPVLLVQGHPATGFARMAGGKLDFHLEPDVHEVGIELPWRLYFDVRIFGERGEWHCWRVQGAHWRGRFAGRDENEWQVKPGKAFSRSYALWGEQFKREGDWVRWSEKRGAVVWTPARYDKDDQQPFRLEVRQRVEFDQETGIAGVVDAMILGFAGGSK